MQFHQPPPWQDRSLHYGPVRALPLRLLWPSSLSWLSILKGTPRHKPDTVNCIPNVFPYPFTGERSSGLLQHRTGSYTNWVLAPFYQSQGQYHYYQFYRALVLKTSSYSNVTDILRNTLIMAISYFQEIRSEHRKLHPCEQSCTGTNKTHIPQKNLSCESCTTTTHIWYVMVLLLHSSHHYLTTTHKLHLCDARRHREISTTPVQIYIFHILQHAHNSATSFRFLKKILAAFLSLLLEFIAIFLPQLPKW